MLAAEAIAAECKSTFNKRAPIRHTAPWIAIHGAVCLIGARLLKVDLHSAAIASAANIGGVASAPVVAAHHQEALVPASILMALVGYAAGNYLAVLTAQLCFWVSQM